MSEAKQPWAVINDTGGSAAVYCGKQAIATVYDSANANMIAASPELLEACKINLRIHELTNRALDLRDSGQQLSADEAMELSVACAHATEILQAAIQKAGGAQ